MDFEKLEKVAMDKTVDDFDVLTMFLLDFNYNNWDEMKQAEILLEEHRPRIAKTLEQVLMSVIGWALGPEIVEELNEH